MTLAGKRTQRGEHRTGTGGHPTVNPGLPLILSDILSPFFGPRRDFSPAFMRSGNHWTIPPLQNRLTVRSIKIETLWWDFWRSLSDFEVICAEPIPKPKHFSYPYMHTYVWKQHLRQYSYSRMKSAFHSVCWYLCGLGWAPVSQNVRMSPEQCAQSGGN